MYRLVVERVIVKRDVGACIPFGSSVDPIRALFRLREVDRIDG